MNHPGAAMMEAVLIGLADPDIAACEAQLRTAQLAADVLALSRLIADDLLFTGPHGLSPGAWSAAM